LTKPDETLARTTEDILARMRARAAARPAAEADAGARAAILYRAREVPLSTFHKYVWASGDGRVPGHMAKAWACPPDEEWDHWVANAIDYMAEEFTNSLLTRLRIEPEVRGILLDRLRAWRGKESAGPGDAGPPKRAKRKPPAQTHLPYRDDE